ncbi:hypothetical protein QJQ45_008306 [Haematococcus lacustris]|nr:hypothetical protein QJQ45_008306 [Haematococcus lacustris]
MSRAIVSGEEELDALLAATQITAMQLGSVVELGSSRATAPCTWQRLQLTNCINSATAAYLPLHSLTHSLLLGGLVVEMAENGDEGIVVEMAEDPTRVAAAAVHNLTQASKVPVRIALLELDCYNTDEEFATSLPLFVDVLDPRNTAACKRWYSMACKTRAKRVSRLWHRCARAVLH